MATSTLTIQIDEGLKEKGEMLFNRFGLDIADAINLFVRKSVEEDKIPFEVKEDFDLDGPYTEEEEALFYSPSNIAAIMDGVRELNEGKVVTFTSDELKSMTPDELEAKANEQRAARK